MRRRRLGPLHPTISQDGKEARVGSQIADGQSGGIENTRRPWSEVRQDLPQLRHPLREAACQQRQGDEPLPHHRVPGVREARVESVRAKGPWRRAGGRPRRRGPGLRHGSEDPMAVAPHQRSTSDHLLIIWKGPSAYRPAGEGGSPGSCRRVAGVAAPLAYPGGVSGYRPMSLPAPILTLTPLTPLTPQKGCFGGRKGGGGGGEGPLPGGEGGGWSPNGRGVREG